MASPTDRFSSPSGQNWVQLVQHLQNSLHAQDNSIDKNFALIIDKKLANWNDTGTIVLKRVNITDEHGEVNKKIIGYMNQGRIVIRTHTGIAFSPSFAAQIDKISNSALQGRVSREQQSTADKPNQQRNASNDARPVRERAAHAQEGNVVQDGEVSDNTIEAPTQEIAAPIMRNFVIRNANNHDEMEEFTAELESMDDATYASIFGFNFSATETDNKVTEKEEKIEHKHKTPTQDITSTPRQTPQSLSGKLANKDATATMLQQARNIESRRFQEKRKERAAKDKEKSKEIRREEEKREIKNEEIKKSEIAASTQRAEQNIKSQRKT